MDELQLCTLLASSFTVLLLSFSAWWWLTSSSSRKKPPSPPALPIIGNLHQLGTLHHRSLHRLSKKHGPLMLLHLGSKPTLVVSSADVAKHVLKTHDLSFADKPALGFLKKIFYDLKDLINLPYGDEWRKQRSIVTRELLNTTSVKSYNSIREQEIGLVVEKITRDYCCNNNSFSATRPPPPLNLSDMFLSFSNDLISRAAFGKKHLSCETARGEKFLTTMVEIVGLLYSFTVGELIPWLGWINSLNGYNAAIDRAVKLRDDVFDDIIEEHLNMVGPTEGNSGNKHNFVDNLLSIYKGYTPGVSIDLVSVKALTLDVLTAATETSTTALVWIMTELIKHPKVMKKLQVEIRDVAKGSKHRITDEDIQKMPYLKAVIQETLRCHPPISVYTRSARERVNLMGYEIQPETMVLINAWAIGQDPSYWDEPEKFMPERFLNSSVDFKGFDFQLIPFGAGRRICPGIGFAEASIKYTIANLVHKFDWALPDGVKGEDIDVTEKPGLTIGKKYPLILVPTLSLSA
ncbi:hypothetical protein ACP275_09G013900 [Erythranthe tilingii]